MRRDIQDALASVGEVAVFAWSLLELLLTRILPLAGFLAGHLLLQFGGLLTSAVVAAAGRRKPRADCDVLLQAEEVRHNEEEDNIVQVAVKEADAENDVLESLMKSRHYKAEEIIREESLILPSLSRRHDEVGADVQVAAAAAAMPAMTDAAAEVGDEQEHAAEAVPSDGQTIALIRASDAAAANEGESSEVVAGREEERRHVSSKGEASADRMDLEPSDVQTSTKSMRKASVRRSRMRVLPPSLSQIKRSLMQRSRRAAASPSPSPSPSPASPAANSIKSPAAGSTLSPGLKKKHMNNTSRKLASPALKIKSSSSYDNFMGKFRKHFLLDPA